MAYDILLNIATIKGESKIAGFEKQIDLLQWSWGESNSGTFHTGGGGGAGKVNVQDLALTKYVDLSSPVFLLNCASGEHIPEATLTVRKSGGKAGDDALNYLVVTMKKIMVSSVVITGTTSDDRLTESVTLNFADVSVKYTQQTDTGTGGDAKTFHWDIEANKGDVS